MSLRVARLLLLFNPSPTGLFLSKAKAMEQERLEKEVRLGYSRGKRSYVSVVREHYLREDISCRSELCLLCRDIPSHGSPKGATFTAAVYVCALCVCVCYLLALREGLKKLFHTHSVSSSTEIFSKRRKIYSL